MGNWTKAALLGCFLLVTVSARRCNVGSVSTDEEGTIVRSNGKLSECSGYCTVRSFTTGPLTLHMLACEEQETFSHADSVCKEDACNVVSGMIPFTNNDITNNVPIGQHTCYVGVTVGSFNSGGAELCNSPCGRMDSTAMVMNKTTPVSAYFCSPHDLCTSLLNSTDASKPLLNTNVNYTCCYLKPAQSSNCNIIGRNVPTPLPPVDKPHSPVACYSAIHLNGTVISGGEYIACQGDCASLTYSLSGNWTGMDLTMYSCDPASVCQGFKLQNDCLDVDGVFKGCCCNSDACIDPTATPPKYPNGTQQIWNECFVGIHTHNYTANHTWTVGSPLMCDGKCGRLTSNMGGLEVEAFYCSRNDWCNLFDVQGTCAPLTFGAINATICCCDDSANCNTHGTDVTPVPATTVRPKNMIACYEAIHVNNMALSGGERFVACDGDCASLTLASTLLGEPYNLTMYTCDPATLCRSMGIANRCAQVAEGLLSGCCCDTDICIEPRRHKFPNGTDEYGHRCFTGIQVGSRPAVGADMPCDGECASVQSSIGGNLTTGFFCAPKSLCEIFGLDNECSTMLGITPPLKTCCCTYKDNCNVHQMNVTIPPYVAPTGSPLSCFSGMAFNGYVFNDQDSYMTCRGSCAQLTFSTTYAGAAMNATIYTCDPTTVCSALNMTNTCGTIGPVSGCCCDWNDCIDVPNRTLKKNPTDPLNCFVGISLLGDKNSSVHQGSIMQCDGECASLYTKISGYDATGYFCAPRSVCNAFDIAQGCKSILTSSGGVQACCCSTSDNCNVKPGDFVVPTNQPSPPSKAPITCYAGLSLSGADGTLISPPDRYMVCNGDCAQVTFTTGMGNTSLQATMYTCDPVSLCKTFNMTNSCGAIPGTPLSGCCCDWDDCIDTKTRVVKKNPADPLNCFVGISILGGANKTQYGSVMMCDGECASIYTKISGLDATGYFCAPRAVCNAFDIAQGCTTLLTTNGNVQACCCSTSDNCNANGDVMIPTNVPPPASKTPIACYAGLSLTGPTGTLLSPPDRYMTCAGDCAQVTFSTGVAGTNLNATMYTCDPVSLCKTFGLQNSCGAIPGTPLSGCCCDFNDCIDLPTKTVKRNPTSPLQCFVGLTLVGNNTKQFGSSMNCDGECASVSTNINGVAAHGYFCAPRALCNAFDIAQGCATLPTNTGMVEGCCCSTTDNCNVKSEVIVPTNQPAPSNANPITCYAGIALNRKILTADDRYMVCAGDCAQITFTSGIGNTSLQATVFTCDPVSLCSQFGLNNSCGNIGGTPVSGCCCNSNDCIDLTALSVKPQPTTVKPTGSAVVSTTIFASVISLVFALVSRY